jgi:putative peptidoglycan lipid II flippase
VRRGPSVARGGTRDPVTPTGRLARVAVVIGLLTVAARAAGFGRTIVFGRVVGRTCLGSVYAAANGVPNILFEVAAGGALSAIAVPMLARRFAAADLDGAGRTASALLTWTVVVLTPLTVLTALLARPIVSGLLGPATGCDRAASVAAGGRMLVVFAIQIVLYGVGIVVGGVLQAAGRFIGPAVAPLLSSLVVVAAYLTFGAGGPRVVDADLRGLGGWREAVLAGGTTLGVAVLSLGLLLPLRRVGLPLRPTFRFAAGEGRTVAAIAVAGLASVGAQQLATAVVIRLSNQVQVDSYVIYLLGATVFLLPWAILAVPLATGLFPRLAATDDPALSGAAAAPSLRLVALLMCAGTAALVATARPVAAVLLLGAPGQGARAPEALAFAIVAFAPGLLGYGIWAVAARALFARRAAGTAAAVTVAGWLLVVVSDLVLVHGATGETVAARLAWGQSLGLTVAGIGTFVAVRRATGKAVYDGFARALGAGLLAGFFAGLAGRVVAAGVGATSLPTSLASSCLAGVVVAAVFVAVLAFVDRGDLRSVVSAVRRHG